MRSIAITGSDESCKKKDVQSLTDIVEWDELNCKTSRMKSTSELSRNNIASTHHAAKHEFESRPEETSTWPHSNEEIFISVTYNCFSVVSRRFFFPLSISRFVLSMLRTKVLTRIALLLC